MKINVQYRGKSGKSVSVDVPAKASVDEFKVAFQALTKTPVERQRFTVVEKTPTKGGKPNALVDGKLLQSYGLGDGSAVLFKDLGPQIGYSTVFFWEYFGPLATYLIVYLFPGFFYGADAAGTTKSTVQDWAMYAWTFHYAKRIFETFFVHRFSHGTMPIFNLFKNCSYYWGFAFFVAYFVNHPLYTAPALDQAKIGLALFAVAEAVNAAVHLQFRFMRPAGSKAKVLPRGILFSLVSCPNYTAEILAWVGFNIATMTVGGVLFMLAGAAQMAIWALGKHKYLRRTFSDYPRARKAMIPFVL